MDEVSRKYHGFSGEQYISKYPYVDDPTNMIIKAFHETGLPIRDINGKHQVGVFNTQSISKEGERVSANDAFIRPIRYKRKNLTVKVQSEALEILINGKNTAYGVKYKTNGTVNTSYASKEVIVSCGPIETPKLLMLSGIGPKEHLQKLNITVKKDLAVGENLQDHLTFNGIVIALNNTSTLVSQKEILNEVCEYEEMGIKRGPLSGNGPNSIAAFIKTKHRLPAPDIQFAIGDLYWTEYIRDIALADSLTIFPTSFYNGLVVRAMNLVPNSRGSIKLNASNPYGPPEIYANYIDDPSDMIPIIKAIKYLLSFEKTKAFTSNGAYFVKESLKPCQNYTWASDDYIKCMTRSYTSVSHHQSGSCKMGPSWDKKAVVDSKLRVYGVSRLRVIDASIMPRVNRGNTVAPALMIGEKGAAYIISQWSSRKERSQNSE